MRRLFISIVSASLCLGFAAGLARANAVTYWNEITLVSVTAGRPGPPGILDVAITQAAVHDAVQAIEGRFEPYYAVIPGACPAPPRPRSPPRRTACSWLSTPRRSPL